MFGRRRRDAAPTLSDARFVGTWRPQGAALDGATGRADDGADRELWPAMRPSDAGAPDYRVQLNPQPGPARAMRGGAVMSRGVGFDTLLGADLLDGSHVAIVNRPNVLIRDPQVVPWEGAPVTLWAERPITDAANTPDVC